MPFKPNDDFQLLKNVKFIDIFLKEKIIVIDIDKIYKRFK